MRGKFWLSVMNELKNRGLQDVLIAVVEGAQGLSRGDHCRLSGGPGSNLHRPSGAPFPEFLLLEGPQGGSGRSAPDLQRPECRGGRGRAQCVRGKMGREICLHRARLAQGLGRSHSVLLLRSGDPQDHLNDERIESLNRVIRKSIKTRGSFPTDEAATKLIYLAIRNFEKDGRKFREWFAGDERG